MPGLRELQRGFAAMLMDGGADPLAGLIAGGPSAAQDRIGIYRNTMRGVLRGALALAYPAVAALVGAEFFDQAAWEFARRQPPRAALLDLYGADFPEFLAAYTPANSLRYLPDVARLEWAVDAAARGPTEEEAEERSIALPGVTLMLAPSLRLLVVGYPAEAIWRAVLCGDDDAIGRIDPGAAAADIAIWRDCDGAGVATLSACAAVFLRRLLADGDAEAALEQAAAAGDDPVAAIAAEVFQAGFARLIPDAQ
jgi:hypothetical protein